MPTPKYLHGHISTYAFQKAGKVKEKEELKTALKWGKFFYDVILDYEIFTYLERKKVLILLVNSIKFGVFLFKL